jgi:hypothetical protein
MGTEGRQAMEQIDNGVQASGIPGVEWIKSARSNQSGNCVEVAQLPGGGVAVRNSRYPDGPALVYTREEMAAFVEGAKDGDFDAFTV